MSHVWWVKFKLWFTVILHYTLSGVHSLLRVFASSAPAHTSSVYKAAYQVASIKTRE